MNDVATKINDSALPRQALIWHESIALIRSIPIFLILLVFLLSGITASGAEHGRRIITTERLWFSLHVKVTDGEGHITGFRWDGMSRKKFI